MSDTATTPNAPVIPASTPVAPQPTSTTGFIDRANAALVKHFGNPENTTPAPTAPETPATPEAATPELGDDGLPADQAAWTAQPRNPDGTFAPKDETTTVTQEVAAVASVEGEPPAAETETPAAEVVSLPPTREGQPDIEIEVTDPAIAEHLRHLANNGLRQREFTRRMANVEAREAELRSIEGALKLAPEVFVSDLAPEVRPRVLQYMLAQHFDEVAPIIQQWWTDDTSRREFLLTERSRVADSKRDLDESVYATRKAAEVRTAINALIPDDTSPEDAQDFARDAEAYLATVSRSEKRILEAKEVPALLERHRRRYGFATAEALGAVNGNSTTSRKAPLPPRLVARPVGDAAQRMAEVKAKNDRLKDTQAQRAAAARVAPVGQGAVPASKPVYTPGQGFEKAAQFVTKNAHLFTKPSA